MTTKHFHATTEPPTGSQVEKAVILAMTEIRARLLADLPALPPAGTCPCGASTFYVVEPGYWRTTRATPASGGWIATADGMDDFTEEGAFEYVECSGCNAAYMKPDDLIWR